MVDRPLGGFPPLNDHGLEVLRKSGEPVATPIDSAKVEYQLRIRSMPGSVVAPDSVNTIPNIANISAPIAGTEYSYALPINCKKFLLQSRFGGEIKFAYGFGETSTDFLTIWKGVSFTDINFYDTRTIYFTSTKTGDVIEVATWV